MAWTCRNCKMEFDVPDKEELGVRSNHLTLHNPSPAQWAEAYDLMDALKRAKDEGERARLRRNFQNRAPLTTDGDVPLAKWWKLGKVNETESV